MSGDRRRRPYWPPGAHYKYTIYADLEQADRWREASAYYHFLLIEPFLVAAADHSAHVLLRLKARQLGRIARGEI